MARRPILNKPRAPVQPTSAHEIERGTSAIRLNERGSHISGLYGMTTSVNQNSNESRDMNGRRVVKRERPSISGYDDDYLIVAPHR